MDEVLLGRPFLKAIEFNLDEHLLNFYDKVHDRHVKELENDNFKAASTKYSGLRYQEPDDDPISLPDAMAAGIDKDSEESITKAFNASVEEAKHNGLSPTGVSSVIQLQKKYKIYSGSN
eukprot:IDg9305t1